MTQTNVTANQTQPNATPAGTLAPVLSSAAFAPLDGYNHDGCSAGHTVQVMKKRGENSRLKQSLAVEVPEFTAAHVAEAVAKHPVLVAEFINTLYAAQRELLIDMAARGVAVVQYADITLDKVAASIVPTVRAVKLSKDSIVNWYNSEAAEVMAVAIAERLGVADSLDAADMTRIQQVSNQVRDNLAKLAAPNAQFDERVRKSLQWAIDSVIASGMDDTGMADRLNSRLNPAVTVATVDLADMLGM